MTVPQAIRIVSRLIVLYLLFWVVSDLTGLPREILGVRGAWLESTGSVRATYYLREEILFLGSNVLRMTMWAALAILFYQCGPRIQRFFGAEVTEPDSLEK